MVIQKTIPGMLARMAAARVTALWFSHHGSLFRLKKNGIGEGDCQPLLRYIHLVSFPVFAFIAISPLYPGHALEFTLDAPVVTILGIAQDHCSKMFI